MCKVCDKVLPLILTFSPKEGVEKHLFAVIPAKAGIPTLLKPLDSRRSLPPQLLGGGGNDRCGAEGFLPAQE
jgi:hypothetical protein